MRILFHHRIASRDGQSVHLEELVTAFESRGHEVLVVGPADIRSLRFGGQLGLVSQIKRRMPRFLYELMEMAYNVPAYFRLARACRRFRPDFIYERYNLFVDAGLWVSRAKGLPLLLEVNGPLFEERSRYDGLALQTMAHKQQTRIWRGADGVLPVSHVLAAQMQAAGVDQGRVMVVPNGVDLARFDAGPGTRDAKRGLGLDDRLVLGFVGFVRSWHALDQVLAFMAARRDLGDFHLLLVGDGPAREDLEKQAEALGLGDRLTVTGVVSRDRVPELLAAFDVALQPGVTSYASPLKLIEYMAAGRAIIAPDSANIRELVQDRASALLFDPDRPGAFAAGLTELCADPVLRSTIAAGARAEIDRQGLTWLNNADRITRRAGELIAARRAKRQTRSGAPGLSGHS